jgi:hypothetical protein
MKKKISKPKFDKWHAHELLDRTYLALDIWDSFICKKVDRLFNEDHPLTKRAHKIAELIAEYYQDAGWAEHDYKEFMTNKNWRTKGMADKK